VNWQGSPDNMRISRVLTAKLTSISCTGIGLFTTRRYSLFIHELLATSLPEILQLNKLRIWDFRPSLCSSGQSSWLQIQRSGFDSRRSQIFWEWEELERGPLSLVSTTEELLERKNSSFGLESREYSRRDLSRWPYGTLYSQKLALTSPETTIALSI
jgi:hypothetical protein